LSEKTCPFKPGKTVEENGFLAIYNRPSFTRLVRWSAVSSIHRHFKTGPITDWKSMAVSHRNPPAIDEHDPGYFIKDARPIRMIHPKSTGQKYKLPTLCITLLWNTLFWINGISTRRTASSKVYVKGDSSPWRKMDFLHALHLYVRTPMLLAAMVDISKVVTSTASVPTTGSPADCNLIPVHH
jgi:hypothetical protein